MNSNENHTQCLLISDGGMQQVAWIPTVRANLKRIRIDGTVFNVKERYSTVPSREVLDDSSDYRRHRKATDLESGSWKRLPE
jgi:hypothetical protein